MAITKKQMELDKIKWEKSVELGSDACGSFDYCAKCDKSKENPCDKAFTAFNKKPAVKKAPVAKAEPATKKAPAKKASAKK